MRLPTFWGLFPIGSAAVDRETAQLWRHREVIHTLFASLHRLVICPWPDL